MSDHVYLHGMVFEGRHGVTDEERRERQPIHLDVELTLDLHPAGTSDDLSQTVDYSDVFQVCRRLVEERSFQLLEGIAETLAAEILTAFPAVEAVRLRVKKTRLPMPAALEHAGVEIARVRGTSQR